jgi:hypothetical protein
MIPILLRNRNVLVDAMLYRIQFADKWCVVDFVNWVSRAAVLYLISIVSFVSTIAVEVLAKTG